MFRNPFSRTSRSADAGPEVPGHLALRHAYQNLALTTDGLWAFYLLSTHDWPYTTLAHRTAVMTDATFRYAELAGHKIWLRGIPTPPHLQEFTTHLVTQTTRLPDAREGRRFDDYVGDAVHHLATLRTRDYLTILGIHLSDTHVKPEQLGALADGDEVAPKLQPLARHLADVTATVARPGLNGTPITSEGLRWAIHTSLAMGAPTPSALTSSEHRGHAISPDAVPAFTNPVIATQDPCAPTTRLHVMRDSQVHESHVAVLHVDAFADRDLDRNDLIPWLAWATHHPTPIHYLVTGHLVPGTTLKQAAELDRRKAKNIAAHYLEHEDDLPANVVAGITRAAEVEAEVSHGTREQGVRFRGVAMLAVTGSTVDDALSHARQLATDAARDQGLTLVHDYAQYAYYRAFTPGEPCPLTGHVTQMPGYYLASAVPTACEKAGDETGLLLGPIAGSNQTAILDPFGGTTRHRSNMMVIVGEPGAGKSALAAALMDHTATLGIRTIGYDPSGPWAALTRMPHLRDHARHISLSGGHRGILVPHTMVTDPQRRLFDTDADWRDAMAEAAQERMELCLDTFRDLLPYGMVTGDTTGAIMGTLEDAVTSVGGAYGTNPWRIVAGLKGLGDVGRNLADRLTAAAQLKTGALIFPDAALDVDDETGPAMLNQAALTIITMEGLALPPADGTNRAHWSREAQRSVPILHLGARFATRTIYADTAPKCVMLDELGISTASGAGSFSSFAVRTAFDSRKWRACAGLVCQNPATLTTLDPQIANLAGAAFIGRLETHTASSALPLLRLPEDSGYHHHIASLDTGGFLMRDWAGHVRRIDVDWEWWHGDLRAAVATGGAPTPSSPNPAAAGWGSSAPDEWLTWGNEHHPPAPSWNHGVA